MKAWLIVTGMRLEVTTADACSLLVFLMVSDTEIMEYSAENSFHVKLST